MPRELAVLDALVPTLMFAFLAAVAIILALDMAMVRFGLYRYVWYPALFRLTIFVCVFSSLGLWVY
jgi:hypothetical protein